MVEKSMRGEVNDEVNTNGEEKKCVTGRKR
jgi:hypothetical protein